MAKFCHACGASLPDGAVFCHDCGQALPQESPAKKTAPVEPRDSSRLHAVPRVAPAPTRGNGAYVAWFLFYFIFFSVITLGIAIPFFLVTTGLAFSPLAEKLWRNVSGVRPLRLQREKERLLPLFKGVYTGAYEADPNLSKGIRLYIKEDMNINAFAFGKSTLVITRGSLELLNDECLKGFIAHEFGHFSHGDTKAILLSTVSNLFMSFIMTKLTDRKNRLESEDKGGFLKWLIDIFYYLFKAIDSIAGLFLMRTSRRNEYLADQFANKSGFGKDLSDVLLEIYSVSVSKPQSVKEQLNSTHPDITLRIERLEKALY